MKNVTNSGASLPVRALDRLDGLILRGWRAFCTLKFGLFLLALIGVCAIVGTMGLAANPSLGDNAIPMARARFFETRWFNGLLLLFAFNLICSTWHVTRMSFTIWRKREFRREPSYYAAGSSPRGEVPATGAERAEAVLRRRFTRVHRDGNAFFAHRGILSRVGPTIVHAGILTVIFSTVIRSWMLWNGTIMTEGRFIAAEGESHNTVLEPIDYAAQMSAQNSKATPVEAWIKVLDFDRIRHPNSEVDAYFSSLVEVRDPATQRVTVAQLDMNNYLRIGHREYHQASFAPVDDGEMPRADFDVREAKTGERIAVTDAGVNTRVRVGDTTLFLEVDGLAPGAAWRLYDAGAPDKAVAQGATTGGQRNAVVFRADQFFSDIVIDKATNQPTNRSNELRNPALRLTVFENGRELGQQWLFVHPELAQVTPDASPRYKLSIADIQIPRDADPASADWNRPGYMRFLIGVEDKELKASVGTEALVIGQASRPFEYTTRSAAAAPDGAEYEVRVLGPTQRYQTIFSVVSEPTATWTTAGVVIIVIGAMMTFLFRYRAFYGLLDPEAGTMRIALVPRWGQSPVQAEFDALVAELSGGKGLIKKKTKADESADEVQPALAST